MWQNESSPGLLDAYRVKGRVDQDFPILAVAGKVFFVLTNKPAVFSVALLFTLVRLTD